MTSFFGLGSSDNRRNNNNNNNNNRQRRNINTYPNRNDDTIREMDSNEISLPKLVKCRSKFNCNLWGRDDLLGLCTSCYREYDSRLRSCTKKDIVAWLLEKQGLNNLDEACLAYAKELVYGKEEIVDPKKVSGVITWKTHFRPKTQYDVIPVKGHSACTYISGCAVLTALLAKDEPDPEVWKSCITKGVKAFHSAKEVDKSLAGHVNLSEILGYLLVTLNVDIKHADFIKHNDTCCILSSKGLDDEQKKNLLATGTLFSILELTEYFKTVLANDWSGVVVTRPPETWSIVRGSHGQIFLRDSHRLLQYDFKSLEVFIKFVEVDNAYFVPMPGFGIGGNQISLTAITFDDQAMLDYDNTIAKKMLSGEGFADNNNNNNNNTSNRKSNAGVNYVVSGRKRFNRVLSIDHHTSYENTGKTGNANAHTLPTEIIKNRLYLSDVHVARNFNSLESANITHILNLTGPGPNGHPRYFNKFANEYCEKKDTYLHICNVYDSNIINRNRNRRNRNNNRMVVDDDTNNNIISLTGNRTSTLENYISRSLTFVQRALRSHPKHAVLIHCESGTNLSAAVVIAYLMKETEHTFKSSLDLLSTKLIANMNKIKPDMGTLMQLMQVELHFKKINTITKQDIKTDHVMSRLGDMGFQADRIKVQHLLSNHNVSAVEALLVQEALEVQAATT